MGWGWMSGRCICKLIWEPREQRRRDWPMFDVFGKQKLTAILSAVTIGAALTFAAATARAGDDTVTEQQILKALTPEKKPLTRGLSAGPKADPGAAAAE